MPRTDVIPTRLAKNSSIVTPAGTTIDATLVTNGVRVVNAPFGSMWLEMSNTAGVSKNVTIRKGSNPPATLGRYGDLIIAVGTGTSREIFMESGRYAQSDGSLYVDFEAGTTGVIKVRAFPKQGMRD
ncbi:MAG: hypothetical protein LC778_10275 [Acidobacteria bacterium]|nr:hypothetical protein [Acidobacteriota bacterium]